MIETIYLMRIEVNIMFILLLGYILIRSQLDNGGQVKSIAFCRVAIATVCILVIDCLCYLVNGIPNNLLLLSLNNILNVAYLINTTVITYFWYRYLDVQLNPNRKVNALGRILRLLPLLTLIVLTVSSLWTHAIFYIDTSNVFHLGKYVFIQVVIAYFYVVVATVKVLLDLKKQRTRQRQRELISLALFFMLPVVGGVVEVFNDTFPVTWTLAALSLSIVYMNLQGYQISTDELTGLNNRRRFTTYLADVMNELHSGNSIFLLMADVDSFKRINDSYGHNEGDIALIQVATILKVVSRSCNVFIARYGGDEFALVLNNGTFEEAKFIKNEIKKECDRANKLLNKPYNLSISIGISEYSYQCGKSIAEFVSEADEGLYDEKARQKKFRLSYMESNHK